MVSRFSGIAVFASAGLPGRSLARSLVAEAKVSFHQRMSSERSERAAKLIKGILMEKINSEHGSDGVTESEPAVSRSANYIMIFLTYCFGAISMIVFVIFLYKGSLNLVSLKLNHTAALGLDIFLSLAFFIQHSIMIRRSFRSRLSKIIKTQYHGAVFTLASGVFLLIMVLFWQKIDYTLASPQGVLRWLLHAVFFLSIAGFTWGVKALGSFDAFGISPIKRYLHGKKPPPTMPFVIRGPYRWVRHPLYFLCLLLIWSCPVLTVDRLLFNVLWTVWILVGAILEERDLVADFGDAYRDYQRSVPMIIPLRI
ncbi:MAG: methyltransferase family protein [Planctomycetota bacterium]|jgi:protein-S-isoprenylcysteine O-methyltransferase Ste14